MEDILDRVLLSQAVVALWYESCRLTAEMNRCPPFDIGDERAMALPSGDLLVYVNRVSTGKTLVSMKIGPDGWALKEG